MTREIVNTGTAPAAIGPYSQAVMAGGMVFCAGQIPLDPVTGELAARDIEGQARRVIANLRAVLEAGGSGLDRIVRLDVYLTDLGQFGVVNSYLTDVFPVDPPARVTVEVSALPLGALVEMAAIAVVDAG